MLSPDTDIYNIGLPLPPNDKHVLIQVSSLKLKEIKLIDLKALISALKNDPDLAALVPDNIPLIMRTLYMCTGCDYVSFFSGLGKATFMRYFFQFASFITGSDGSSLAHIGLQNGAYMKGFLSFLRLVGTVYFKKHSTGFDTQSPSSHFLRYANAQDDTTQHREWIDEIRQTISDRTTYDTGMIPSTEALFYHWKRTCWILHMWGQADENDMTLTNF